MTTETTTASYQRIIDSVNSLGLGISISKTACDSHPFRWEADGEHWGTGFSQDIGSAISEALMSAETPIEEIALDIKNDPYIDGDEKRFLQVYGAITNFELYSCFAGECLIESNGDGIRDNIPTATLVKCHQDLLKHARDVKRVLIDRLANEITGAPQNG